MVRGGVASVAMAAAAMSLPATTAVEAQVPVQLPAATVATNTALIRRYWEEIWAAHNPDAMDGLYAPDWTGHFVAGEFSGPASHKRLAMGFLAAFPDAQFSVDRLFGEGDRVSSLVTIRGTHLGEFRGLARTGRPITWVEMDIHRIAGGLIAEEWQQYDLLSLLKQLGAGC
jgi:predicted ester cyclase